MRGREERGGAREGKEEGEREEGEGGGEMEGGGGGRGKGRKREIIREEGDKKVD